MELEIINYIKEARQHGLGDDLIKQNLLNAGWDAGTIEENFAHEKAIEDQAKLPATFDAQHLVHAETASFKTAVGAAATSSQAPAAQSAPAQNAAPQSVAAQPMAAKAALIAAIVIVVLAAAAYAYYTYAYNNPTKTWQKFLQAKQDTIYQSTINFTYADPNSLNSSSSLISLQNLKLAVNGNFYVNVSNAASPQSSSTVEYTFNDGNTGFSTGFQYALLGNVLYFNVGSNPLLAGLTGLSQNGQQVQWVKIDLNKLEQASSTASSLSSQQLKNIFNSDLASQLQQIWSNANVITVSKFDGTETINGVRTLHFQNQLDKQALKTAVSQMLTKIVSAFNSQGAAIGSQNTSQAQTVINDIIDKIQVTDMETWIGATDFKLYQVKFASNAPSIVSAIESMINNQSGLSLATGSSRDAKRVADVRQMSSALELYFNDNNGYPDGNNGSPIGLTPNYMTTLPVAPEPADGSCTDYYNSYWYAPAGKKQVVNGKTIYSSYTMTFCLGGTSGTYKAGIAELTPQGIEDSIVCPSVNASQCINSSPVAAGQSAQDLAQKVIDSINFNATVNIMATYHDYGKNQQLVAPANAYDLLQNLHP